MKTRATKEDVLKQLSKVNTDLDVIRMRLFRILYPDLIVGNLGQSYSHSLDQMKLIYKLIGENITHIEGYMNSKSTPEEVQEKAYAELKTVSRDSKCPKCGCDKITIAIKTQSPVGNWHSLGKEQNDLYRKYSYQVLQRQCTDCYYLWYEKPLDEKPLEAQEKKCGAESAQPTTDKTICPDYGPGKKCKWMDAFCPNTPCKALARDCVSYAKRRESDLCVGAVVTLINRKYYDMKIQMESGLVIGISFDEDTRFVVDRVDSQCVVIRTSIGTAWFILHIDNKNDIKRLTY